MVSGTLSRRRCFYYYDHAHAFSAMKQIPFAISRNLELSGFISREPIELLIRRDYKYEITPRNLSVRRCFSILACYTARYAIPYDFIKATKTTLCSKLCPINDSMIFKTPMESFMPEGFKASCPTSRYSFGAFRLCEGNRCRLVWE